MFNWYGNHKIGILGSSNSGKTILLTSLLWNLSDHDPERFFVGKGTHVSNFRIKKSGDHDFGFARHKNTFIQKHRWPEKTADFSVACCCYDRSGSLCGRQVSFVDIPGERMSDILLWLAGSYSEWVKNLEEFWQDNPHINEIIEPYRKLAREPQSSFGDLADMYKRAMWAMLDTFCPITPSTYYLGTDGQMLGDHNNSDRERAISSRHVWGDKELLPLPPEWLAAHPKHAKMQEKIFRAYKKTVVKPLFSEIDSCDNFIFCVDILNILMSGPGLLLQTQRETKDFIDFLAPGKFVQWMNSIGRNPPRLAFVATKSDMVSGDDKDNLDLLLKDFAHSLMSSGIKYHRFICSACVSTELKECSDGQIKLVGHDRDNPKLEIEVGAKLPELWPDTWDIAQYRFPEVAPVISATRPPKQKNLDKIFEFIVEDVDPGDNAK